MSPSEIAAYRRRRYVIARPGRRLAPTHVQTRSPPMTATGTWIAAVLGNKTMAKGRCKLATVGTKPLKALRHRSLDSRRWATSRVIRSRPSLRRVLTAVGVSRAGRTGSS